MRHIWLLFLVLLFSFEAKPQAFIDPQLRAKLLDKTSFLQVVVTFHGEAAPTAQHLHLLEQVGITRGVTLQNLPIAGVLATAAQVQALAANSTVRSVFYNQKLDLENDRGTALTGVDRARAEPVFTARNGGLPISGKGIGLVVNDSGVDGTHPDHEYGANLVQNVLASTNLNAVSGILPYTPIENVPNTDATGGHGTHVAGIAGGTGEASGGKYEGVAPGAALIGYGSGAALAILDVLSAFDWAITNQVRYNIRIVTNSWGTTSDIGTPVNPFDPINLATKRCVDRNIVVVFSAGNSGSASGTITGNYKKAPWVICVAAGDKQGRLSDFSSRGVAGGGGSFQYLDQTYTWEDRPTVTAPGQAIISTRAISPVGALGTPTDVETIEPAHLPYYTTLDGTSMAAPHVAGIVALLLEANPQLTPAQVKQILQATATNVPGRAAWEVGAGYVNAYAAIDAAFRTPASYGGTLNMNRAFVSRVHTSGSEEAFTIDYSPTNTAGNQLTFNVAPGTTALEATFNTYGALGLTGNTTNLVLTSPGGARYSAGIPVAFALYYDRGVAVANPEAGTWTLAVEGLNGLGLPETIEGVIRQSVISGTTGLGDITGHAAEASIRLAISNRLMDGKTGKFLPSGLVTRLDLADYLLMGQAVRQYLPPNGTVNFSDVSTGQRLLVESVMARGAALRDRELTGNSLITSAGAGSFNPSAYVTRAELAYSIVQSLGLQVYAESLQGQPVTVTVDGQAIPIDDAGQIPAHLRGHVQAALNLNLINAFYSLTQGPFDLFPKLRASFKPQQNITRADFAVIITRTFEQWQANEQALVQQLEQEVVNPALEWAVYPNPASDRLNVRVGQLAQEGYGRVLLLNANGQVVEQTNQYLTPNATVELDVARYPKGAYWLRVEADGMEALVERIVLN